MPEGRRLEQEIEVRGETLMAITGIESEIVKTAIDEWEVKVRE